ncbi:unnamed protein product [Colias eurytheme]|nr:unnamed protein product [Colias eurytheme]
MSKRTRRIYCQVNGCSNDSVSKPEMSFFTIPSDPERRLKWLHLIDRKELIGKNIQCHRLCEVHFSKDVIKTYPFRKLLAKDSLPSLFLPVTKRDNQTQTSETYSSISRLAIPKIEKIDLPANSSEETLTENNKAKRRKYCTVTKL